MLALINTFYSSMWLIVLCVLVLMPLLYSPYYYFRYESTMKDSAESGMQLRMPFLST